MLWGIIYCLVLGLSKTSGQSVTNTTAERLSATTQVLNQTATFISQTSLLRTTTESNSVIHTQQINASISSIGPTTIPSSCLTESPRVYTTSSFSSNIVSTSRNNAISMSSATNLVSPTSTDIADSQYTSIISTASLPDTMSPHPTISSTLYTTSIIGETSTPQPPVSQAI